MIRTIGVYLLFAAVALRALLVFAGDGQLPLVMALLAAYALLLSAGPWPIRHSTASAPFHALPEAVVRPTWTQRFLPLVYLLLQTGLVAALLFIPATEDFFGNLFIPLSMDAVLSFGRRRGFSQLSPFL